MRLLRGDALHDIAAHILGGIELRLLRQIANADALGRPGLAGEFLVLPGHDPHQRRLAGAVDADDADLGAGKEGEPDVLQHLLAARIGLGHFLQCVDVLIGSHELFVNFEGNWRLL